jgi:hypothetical protein
MKSRKDVKACVERIIGKFAVISVRANGKNNTLHPNSMLIGDKKYIIVLRKVLPPEAREGINFEVKLGQSGIEWALPDLENTVRQAKLINEISDYMGEAPT